jgi:pimeloyl-ACP methyl ester carboxylesterase
MSLMNTVISQDGTHIEYSRAGTGPAVILVDGAMCYRDSGPSGPLAGRLAPDFTVYTYDRRGRGGSGDTAPYALQREIEDLAALFEAAGGSAYLYGISSGGALALEATNAGLPVEKLAIYETPYYVEPADYLPRLNAALEAGDRARAVRLFMSIVGVPSFVIALMRFMPAWSTLKAVAHTLPYDHAVLDPGKRIPADRWTTTRVPILVMDGGKSPAPMRNAQRALFEVLQNAEHRTIDGQTHLLKPQAIAPILRDYFSKP